MGAITKIRQLSPYFLATVGALFIAFMVIQDSSCQSSRDARRSAEQIVVAEINGDEISLADFETKTTLSKSISTSSTWGCLLGIRLIF